LVAEVTPEQAAEAVRTQFGWKPDGNGGFLLPPDADGGMQKTIRIEFVHPKPQPDDPEYTGTRLLPSPDRFAAPIIDAEE
jgi:hypothetical protein